MRTAIVSLLVGSTGAPALYVLLAVVQPEGFADLRGASLLTFAVYFVVGWAISALFTVPIGMVALLFLRGSSWLGFGFYILAALVVAAILSYAVIQRPPSWELVAMATANAILIRIMELAIDGGKRRAPL